MRTLAPRDRAGREARFALAQVRGPDHGNEYGTRASFPVTPVAGGLAAAFSVRRSHPTALSVLLIGAKKQEGQGLNIP